MRIIKADSLTEVVKKLCIEAACHLPQDVKESIKTCRACEDLSSASEECPCIR